MQHLAEFLNHGILPFVGRDAERERIVAFWRGTFEATEMRAMLLLGEAGVGKSRLLDDAMARVAEAGGSVVHVKLYPEAAVSLVELVARALWHPGAGRTLLAEEPASSLPSITGALQRLARLRPTLVVVEDLHLLAAEAVGDFTRLLRQIGDETISLLVLARPLELAARGALEQYLVDELLLDGLSEAGCAEVWKTVTGAELGAEVRAALFEVTAGNPLALRSALRGALQRIGADRAAAATAWRSPQGRADLVRTLRRSVGLLAEGMTADLDAALLDAARRIAPLGEVFARESAAMLLDGDETILDALISGGLVATAVAPPAHLPIEPAAGPPLSFTHTLLHRELVRTARVDGERLVSVVATSPLYSLLPFSLIAAAPIAAPDADIATVRRAFNRTLQVEIAVQRSTMWRSATVVWAAAARLLEMRLGAWPRPDWEEKIVRLVHHRINLARRAAPEELPHWLDHLRWLSADASSDELMLGRLHEIANRCLLPGSDRGELARSMWLEVQSLASARPHLQATFPFVECIIALCITAGGAGDERTLRAIEEHVAELLRVTTLSAMIRSVIELKVRPQFLQLFDDEAEVAVRLAFVDGIEERIDRSDLGVWKFCMNFLSDACLVDRFEASYEAIVRFARDQGSVRSALDLEIRHLCFRAGRGDAIEGIVASLDEGLGGLREANQSAGVAPSVIPLVDALLLRGEAATARALVECHGADTSSLGHDHRTLLGLADTAEAAEAATPVTSATRASRATLDSPAPTRPLRLRDVVSVLARHVARDAAIARGTRRARMAASDRALAADTIAAVEWLLAPGRSLHALVPALLEKSTGLVDATTIEHWRRRLEAIDTGVTEPRAESSLDGPWRITMLGTIGARRGEREPRLQGARARMLLAVMVANAMLDEPLSSAEFARLVAGDATMAIENARNIQKTTVHRLREALGQDAILTDGASPRLNPAIIEVDLLHAHAHVVAAREALRSTSPMQARVAILAALAIVGTEVVFPSLFDDFIEAMREDFENDLRTTTLDVARALMREGGAADATEILRLAASALPGDGGIAELLQQSLAAVGRRADAVRVERRALDG
jgi:hypothetical protein